MYDISIVLPTIRTHLLEDLYKSICRSCDRHNFELICVGPFDIPASLSSHNNITYIKDYGSPTRAIQIACIHAQGKLIHPLVDDCFYYPKTLSDTIDLYHQNCSRQDILGMRFFENPEHYKKIKEGKTTEQRTSLRDQSHPDSYWFAGPSYGMLQGINPNWGITCLFLADTHLIHGFGGWDCQFEYNNHSTHDLLCRLQKHGSKFLLINYDVFVANWYEGTTVDHAPVHYGQTNDQPLFNQIWARSNTRHRIDINNWQKSPEIWARRFNNKKPSTYKEMMDETSLSE